MYVPSLHRHRFRLIDYQLHIRRLWLWRECHWVSFILSDDLLGLTFRTSFDDVWILTMPAFEWIKWYPDTPGAQAFPQ
jgi:hypothetical protein